MDGNCRLCGDSKPLKESHIVSAFVYRWFKRGRVNPNRPLVMLDEATKTYSLEQDGVKCPLLCADCEQRIGQWERQFKERFFGPFHQTPGAALRYEGWLALFAVSIVWRVLTYHLEHDDVSAWEPALAKGAVAATKTWRAFLNGEARSPSPFDLHLVPISQDTAAGTGTYVKEALETVVAAHRVSKEQYVFVKLGALLMVGIISDLPVRSWRWRHTKIDVKNGIWGGRSDFAVPVTVHDYLRQRTRKTLRVLTSPKPPLKRRGWRAD